MTSPRSETRRASRRFAPHGASSAVGSLRQRLLLAWLSGCLVFPSGCASHRPADPSALPSAVPTIPAVWRSPLDRDHPLVGKVWDVAAARFVDPAVVLDAAARAPLVVTGEQHDNADAHQLEGSILRAMTRGGRRPALVAEMLDETEQSAIERTLADPTMDVDAFARAVDWAHSGWPDWSLYRPVFAIAIEGRLPVVAAGVDRSRTMEIAERGASAVDPTLVRTFALDRPLDPGVQKALRDEMRQVHCGMLPESMLDAMVLVQRLRDAVLASHLVDTTHSDGGLLIAGNGHARSDRGVPAIALRALGRRVLSIGLVEVSHSLAEPFAYAASFSASGLPFDYVWFTPRASDVDHCAEVRVRPRKS